MTSIRRLHATEIECRVAQCGKKQDGSAWCSILLYKDARVDMRILDEVYGPSGWQREHRLLGERLYCTISIWDDDKKQWIKKEDVGTESNTEKEKGQASDAFKRAGFNVGIGRELYTAPKIFVNLAPGEWDEKNGKVVPKIVLDVKEINYDGNGSISSLVLVDSRTGAVKYKWGNVPAQNPAPSVYTIPKVTMDQNHKGWQKMCDAVVAGTYTIEKIKEIYSLPNYAEAALKEYITSKAL
ncbi:MAG: hypothetical protein IKL91_05620 [Bacteroidales bacterium]|nr:hypothetical protein [Bacteroidales bacterium]